jgi:hypothetical protein
MIQTVERPEGLALRGLREKDTIKKTRRFKIVRGG